MAGIPKYQPSVTERPALQQSLTPRASGDDFGAAIGRGMQGLAQGVQQVGNQLYDLRQLEANAEAKAALNEFSAWEREARLEFGNLRGRAAVDGRAAYEKKVAEQRRLFGENLRPDAQGYYGTASEARMQSALENAAVHTNNEKIQWIDGEYTARQQSFADDALAAWQSPERVRETIQAGRMEIRAQAGLHGWGAEELENRERNYVSSTLTNVVLRQGQDDPIAAAEYVLANPNLFTAADAFNLIDKLQPAVQDAAAREAMADNGGVPGAAGPQFSERFEGLLASLPRDQSATVRENAEKRFNTMQTEAAVGLKASIEVVSDNAPTAIQNTGTFDGELPTQETFIAAYGAQEGPLRFAAFENQIQTSEQVYDMRTMSADEIAAVVSGAVPQSSGTDAALEQKRYEVVSAAAAQAIEAREADPAGYVQSVFPDVAAAWSNATDAQGIKAAVNATQAAQEHLGIESMQLLPKPYADAVAAQFANLEATGDVRVKALTDALTITDDPTQQRMIFDQMVEAGVPEQAGGAVEAYMRGDVGAAKRLFQAAMLDPAKLPGQIAEKATAINEEIQNQLMAEGQVGDLYYGLGNGDAMNYEAAQRDAKLLTSAVQLRLMSGEDLATAVRGVGKDLFGDVVPATSNGAVNAQILVPAGQDPQPVLAGLNVLQGQVRAALSFVPPDISNENGEVAVITAATGNYIENVMTEGYFRNAEGGYVFIDPYAGAAVAGPDGRPLVFSDAQVIDASKSPNSQPAALDQWMTGTEYQAPVGAEEGF